MWKYRQKVVQIAVFMVQSPWPGGHFIPVFMLKNTILMLNVLHPFWVKTGGCFAGQNEIQVKMILASFDAQFPLSSNPTYS